MEDMNLLRDLPPNLGSQLALTVHRRILARCAFFKGASDASLMAILTGLESVIYVPAQVICIEGQPVNYVTFVHRGNLELVRPVVHVTVCNGM